MKPCEQQQNIALYVDGELEGEKLARFEAHLAQCPACQEELEQVRELLRQLRDLPVVDVPAQLPARLHAALIEEAGKARIRRPRPTWLPMAAAVSAILVGGVILVGGALRMGQTGGNDGAQYLMQAEMAPASDGMESAASVAQESAAATAEVEATSEAPRLAYVAPPPSDQGGKFGASSPTAQSGDASEAPAADDEQMYDLAQSADAATGAATAKVLGGDDEATSEALEDNATPTDETPSGEQTVWNHFIDWCMGALPWLAAALVVGGLATVIALPLVRRAQRRRSGKE